MDWIPDIETVHIRGPHEYLKPPLITEEQTRRLRSSYSRFAGSVFFFFFFCFFFVFFFVFFLFFFLFFWFCFYFFLFISFCFFLSFCLYLFYVWFLYFFFSPFSFLGVYVFGLNKKLFFWFQIQIHQTLQI